MRRIIIILGKEILFWVWWLQGRVGRKAYLGTPEKVTVIIPGYRPARARNLDPLVRHLLRCDWVGKVIISNNNPAYQVEDWVKVRSPRLVLINQPTRRGCGIAYEIAGREEADYFIFIDDDFLITPRKLSRLFRALLDQPEIPHGLAGEYNGAYFERQEMEVDVLFQVFAMTKAHVKKYLALYAEMRLNYNVSEVSIEFYSDDIVISRCGSGRPRIHDTGFLLRCRTANSPDVAIHMDGDFWKHRQIVTRVLDQLEQTQ